MIGGKWKKGKEEKVKGSANVEKEVDIFLLAILGGLLFLNNILFSFYWLIKI